MKQPCIIDNILDNIARTIGDAFTGSEITRFFDTTNLMQIDPTNTTKWKRIYDSFITYQDKYHCSNGVLAFIKKTAQPSVFLNNPISYTPYIENLNRALSMCGYRLSIDGKLLRVPAANTLNESSTAYNELRRLMESRNIHSEVIRYCAKEISNDNYFHAVFESVKGLCYRIRSMSGVTCDGTKLVSEVFKKDAPILQINALLTESERDEQDGFRFLLLSIIQMFRNPLAHEVKIEWHITQADALDLFSTLSFIHRKLDQAFNTHTHKSVAHP